ncbi:RNA polymerase sigma-70 factor, ECF subfamily [Geodermatophilus dictyosporus]|uniref:RNA polymerase sigma-70 factor, ECF subfamily n=1 Tax=Geodermatophilus dictyosporus TaxID=1523247 RepID=A0A1I5KLY6_9ACTN|nr:RNA polymerase subunit sigma-70 [Geodermatophilus dictyosporus]SFO86084.1 RNA polymerase sigma-70 factor, ECF subfamily [Geodermatophilus dictyosporus]
MTPDDDVAAARAGDEAAFTRLAQRHRRELAAHCYRMLGSPHDAEDALQETLLAAWRGLPGFEGRSSLRTWLYRVATSVCLRQARRRPRLLSPDAGPPRSDVTDLGEPVPGPVWLEPLPEDLADDRTDDLDPATAYLRRESVELAYVAALQHLPATQRAVLLLREVLGYSAAETAALLGTTPASVNSALQRARGGLAERLPARSQQAELARLGGAGRAALVERFVAAWESADVDALLGLLTDDVRFTMPPLPAWFAGRHDVGRFLAQRVFATPWRLRPATVNASAGLLCEQHADGAWRPGSVIVLGLREGRVGWIAGFVDPALHALFVTGSAGDR